MDRLRLAVGLIQIAIAIVATMIAADILPSNPELNAALIALSTALSGPLKLRHLHSPNWPRRSSSWKRKSTI